MHVSGHAIELRINAEDPDAGFRPDPGTLTLWEPPEAPAGSELRLDSIARAGYSVPPFYDSLLGKLILKAANRALLLDAASSSVDAFRVEGVRTTLPLHARVLASPEFRSGSYDLDTLASVMARAGTEA